MAASLPMYDWPELREATDTWWEILSGALRTAGLGDVPDHLVRDAEPSSLWAASDLLLSQTCGYPLMHAWDGRLQIIATPHYAVEGCDGPEYCSFIVVRDDSQYVGLAALRGATAAYNVEDSQSGYAALRAAVAPLAREGRFFGAAIRSGSHLNSLQMVARGEADVCATDSVVWALAQRHRPELTHSIRVLATTPSAPGLPYVTSSRRSPAEVHRMRDALMSAVHHATFPTIRDTLFITGFTPLERNDYRRILAMEQESAKTGYTALR